MEARNSNTKFKYGKTAMYTVVAGLFLGTGCAYTTVQNSGGYAPRDEGRMSAAAEEGARWSPAPVKKEKKVVRGAGDDEKRFFRKMSRRDPAFNGGKTAPTPAKKPAKVARKVQKKAPVKKAEPAKAAVKKTAVPVKKVAAKPAVKKRTAAMVKMEPDGTSYFQPRETPAAKGGNDAGAGKTSLVSYGAAPKAKKGKTPLFGDAGKNEYYQIGKASWYGPGFNGRPTASGEIFNSRKLTAAHRELPMGSIVIVRNMENGREVVLRINDRGPFVKGRVLDVSEYASERLGFKERGLTTVGIKIIRRGKGKSKKAGTTKFVYARKSISKPDGKTKKPVPLKKKIRLDTKDYKTENVLKNFMSLQVGLFENEFNANSLKFALKKFKLPVFVLKRGQMFVVKLGKFTDRKLAEDIRAKLNDAGFTAFITSN